MKMSLNARWAQLQDKAHAVTLRERMIITGAVAVLLLGLFDQLLLRPWLVEREKLTREQSLLNEKSVQLSQQLTDLETQLANDPNQRLRNHIAQLETQHGVVDRDIAKITDGMIAPELMPSLLGELLSERSGMHVQSIKSTPAQQVMSADKNNPDAPGIYRHDLALRLQGNFEQVQKYLQAIESLPQTLVWDELDFTMERYPNGELQLTVHTLSAREELIRVRE